MFERCCEKRSTITYEIIHNPKPISLSADMDEIIKNLLWYAPNIDSYQAQKNEMISNSVYSDFSFSYIMQKMDIVEDRDVKWLEPSEAVDNDDWNYYEGEICCSCQKIIISRCKSLSKTNDLLRCIRNCIAHGHFSITNDYLIGFNKQTSKNNPTGINKAVIKIKPKCLLDAIRALSLPSAKEALIGYAFERIGYTVLRNETISKAYRPDLFLEKNGKKYAIEVKDYNGMRYLHPEDLDEYLSAANVMLPDAELILFIDTSRVTKAVREKEKEISGFRIVDLAQVIEMLKENPVDILA